MSTELHEIKNIHFKYKAEHAWSYSKSKWIRNLTTLTKFQFDSFGNQFITSGYQLSFNVMQDASREFTKP